MLAVRGALPFNLKLGFLERLCEDTLSRFGREGEAVGLQFVSSTKMAQLNARYAKKSAATDVLSFETDQPGALGDVVICSRLAQAQALTHGAPLDSEVGLLFVHGLLHLLGEDHQNEAGVERMRSLQNEILADSHLEAPRYP